MNYVKLCIMVCNSLMVAAEDVCPRADRFRFRARGAELQDAES